MRFSLTVHQMACLFYIAMFLSSCVIEVLSNDPKRRTCCSNVTMFEVRDPVQICAHVSARRDAFGKILCHEAYVFLTQNNKKHCINVNAPWINGTLEELKQKGNPCKGTPI